MTDKHNQSFFGQKVGIIVKSNKKNEPFLYFHCIRKKENGIWEKPSLNEGKIVKFNICEIIEMLFVLSQKKTEWSTIHIFNNETTKISIKKHETDQAFWINIGKYNRLLKYPQSEFLKRLFEHILQEKIEFATTSLPNSSTINDYH